MIQVGQVLDKYELLERVGQGGMAIVYRGLDRSLKRVVAIKVLHKHLSDYQEARDRFEREAQAVAKLRHENILEIFDYAAQPDAEAYIVTEFIEGQTLKQVITERPIAFPEIGAMLILQVGRALAHAHAHGILHRDVKPENIMIRSDGVVKLMDFGISHMVDLERLTVTGQLLGSPAYMAPEHVEGRPLDFRTDVFAAGIVLYQLCVGRLPFEGKNPHEVLKRIAECKFIDPRTANPRIGNRLGRIILRAMAAAPSDRFPAIGEMVTALEAYLEESGLPTDKIAGELARYFAAPAAYEQALEDRLIDHLTRRGQQLLDQDDRPGALDVFDRVLTIDSDNERVIAILDGINRRLRFRAVGLGLLAAAVISGGAFLIHKKSEPPRTDSPPPPDPVTAAGYDPITRTHADDPPPPELADAAVAVVEPDASAQTALRPAVVPDASTGTGAAVLATEIRVSPPRDAEYQVDGGPWLPVDNGRIVLELARDADVQVRNTTGCCEQAGATVSPGKQAMIVTYSLPARIVPRCKLPGVEVRVGATVAFLDKPFPVVWNKSTDASKIVAVTFLHEHVAPTPIEVTVHPNQALDVACVER